MTEVWATGEAYEPYVGRWSRLVAGSVPGLARRSDGSTLARRRLWDRRPHRRHPPPLFAAPGCRCGSRQGIRRLGSGARGGLSGPVRGRGRHPAPGRCRGCRRVGARPELRARSGRRAPSNAPGGPRGRCRCLRLGLRREDGAHAALLGCRPGTRPGRGRFRRRRPVPALSSRSPRDAVARQRAPWCKRPSH